MQASSSSVFPSHEQRINENSSSQANVGSGGILKSETVSRKALDKVIFILNLILPQVMNIHFCQMFVEGNNNSALSPAGVNCQFSILIKLLCFQSDGYANRIHYFV